MTEHSVPLPEAGVCPVTGARSLPRDGTPLSPSPTIARWRDEAPITPLVYGDGHEGWIITRDGVAQEALSDPRLSRARSRRFPLDAPEDPADVIDERAQEALRVASILDQDGEHHARLRRAIAPRFSVKAARALRPAIARIVSDALDAMLRLDPPVDVNASFAQIVAARVHCLVLGIPDAMNAEFDRLFVGPSSTQAKFDFVRAVVEAKRDARADDVVSDLLESELSPAEVEGLAFTLMTSGRDSVAYMISTTTVALLVHPEQRERLHRDPSLIETAVEEFMRVGAMFLTLFPRLATEDLDIEGVHVQADTSVVVSPVAVNRDERRFPSPDEFDVTRDAFGHLGFSFGIHGCVGQQVARVEIKEAISQLLERLPALRLEHADQLSPQPFAHSVGTYEAGGVYVDWR